MNEPEAQEPTDRQERLDRALKECLALRAGQALGVPLRLEDAQLLDEMRRLGIVHPGLGPDVMDTCEWAHDALCHILSSFIHMPLVVPATRLAELGPEWSGVPVARRSDALQWASCKVLESLLPPRPPVPECDHRYRCPDIVCACPCHLIRRAASWWTVGALKHELGEVRQARLAGNVAGVLRRAVREWEPVWQRMCADPAGFASDLGAPLDPE